MLKSSLLVIIRFKTKSITWNKNTAELQCLIEATKTEWIKGKFWDANGITKHWEKPLSSERQNYRIQEQGKNSNARDTQLEGHNVQLNDIVHFEQQYLAKFHEAKLPNSKRFIKKHSVVLSKRLNLPRKKLPRLKPLSEFKFVNLILDL